jgi:competence protein ComEC
MPWLLAAFVGGVFVLQQQAALPPLPWAVTLAVSALLLLALAAWRGSGTGQGARRRAWFTLALAAAAVAGFAHAATFAHLRLADELAFADEGRDVVVTGVVASLPAQLERGTRFEFAVEEVTPAEVHVPQRVSLAWYGAAVRVRAAERWRFTVRLRRPHGLLNPGGFDLEAWMLERGIRAAGYVRENAATAPQRLASIVWQPGPLVDRARDVLRERLQRHLAERRFGGVLLALVLGDQRAIEEADWTLFNRTGISHLVSISGLHVTMIAGLAAAALGAVWRRSPRALALAPVQSAAAVAAVSTAFAYCLLAGWGVPAQRTFLMLAVVAAAWLARRETAAASTLACAAAVVCLLDPWAAIAAGFWLSFGAVAAILWTVQSRAQASLPGWRARLHEAVRVQIAVTVALVPLTLALFQQVSVVSPLANALAIPLVSLLVTPMALAAAALAWLPAPFDGLCTGLLGAAHALFDLLAWVLQGLVQWRWAALSFAAPPSWAIAIALVGVAWLLAPSGWPLRWLGLTWMLPLIAVPAERPREGELWLTALDIGQGMAVLVETPGRAILYDTGPRYSAHSDAGARLIAPYLRWRGIDRLDLMVVSHLDSDHSGGAAAVLRDLPVGEVWSSIGPDHAALLGAATARRCQTGLEARFGALRLSVLHPEAGDYGRRLSTNALSCVVALEAGATRVLLTGDLPAREEAPLIARVSFAPVRVVSAPHHGSRNSSRAAFVAAVPAEWVLVQAGYRNRFGHPDPQVVARWRAAGAVVARTDHHGAVQWRFGADGSAQVLAARRTHARYWHNQPDAAGLPPRSRSEESDEAAAMPAGVPTGLPIDKMHIPADPPDVLDPAGFLLD